MTSTKKIKAFALVDSFSGALKCFEVYPVNDANGPGWARPWIYDKKVRLAQDIKGSTEDDEVIVPITISFTLPTTSKAKK